jgi:hypothetical protein
MIVQSVPVEMSAFHALRTGTDKGFEDQCVNGDLVYLAGLVGMDS